ncbi:MAG: hypothetical protein QGH94_01220 [Phycisphaerae bacterium]|jgi:hypothetical protein|nr:hypothetical protein [Phycisphaerae bacterium]MDP7286590.1 hypothetical protein [Phycisphaerae bacterium]
MPTNHNDVNMSIAPPGDLGERTRRQMYELMALNYHGVDWDEFNRDLDAKQFVMIGIVDGQARGFTTGRCFTQTFGAGLQAEVLFSGDTIIAESDRGNPIWSTLWLQHAMSLAQTCKRPLYWMLTSKGHLTYRFLSIWFKEFYPRCDRPIPEDISELLDALGRDYAGPNYDARRCVAPCAHGQRLRGGVAEPGEKERGNQHVKFFLEQNPGWRQGDELVCIARLAADNLRGSLARRLKTEPTAT